MKTLRILIADDHQLLTDGISAVLAEHPGWEILEPANNGRELLERLATAQADLVLLDLNMPQLDGIRALEIIRGQYPSLKVLVLTNYNQPQLLAEVRKLGANGYLLKNSPASVLKTAIGVIVEGGTYFEELRAQETQLPSYFLDEFMKKYQLTKREVEIIRMVGSELTSREIGTQLSISEFTVNTHRKNILRKLELKNTAGLLNFAKHHGIL
ncbi:response regulator [Chitinophaga sp. GCM10012297]|uniref:Response regulator transcription factor n=1 Tax=Chitinophaga chungangae TaxID=2821488 RepID=A0ABS3YH49_9BACT|nr:response regulator transcription factor [Chitinophaga chungangae]MBO9153775.1 response regulator transcription factor [Chitinophaga chungangae]